MPARQKPIKSLAQAAALGRNGDTLLAHISPAEAQWAARAQGGVSINPETGLPEFFSFGGILKSVAKAAGALVGGYFGGPAGAALGAGAATKLTGGSWGDALSTGLVSGIGAYGLQSSGLTGNWGGGFDSGTGLFGQSTSPLSTAGNDTVASGMLSGNSGGGSGGFSLAKILPLAGVAATALAGSPKQPKVQGGTSQPGYDGPTGPDWSTYKPLNRQPQDYYGDYLTYGQDGGEHQFYDTVNPAPQFKKGGGPISAANGRFGDTELAHVNPAEKRLLKGLGGAGTRNPKDGALEYYEDAGGDGGHGGPVGQGGHNDVGHSGGSNGGGGNNNGGGGANYAGTHVGNENAAQGVANAHNTGANFTGGNSTSGGGADPGLAGGIQINRLGKGLTPEEATRMQMASFAKSAAPGSGEAIGTQKGASDGDFGSSLGNFVGRLVGVHTYPNAVSSWSSDTPETTSYHDVTTVDPLKGALAVGGMFSPVASLASLGYSIANRLGLSGPSYAFQGHDLFGGGWSSNAPGSGNVSSSPDRGSNPHDAGSGQDRSQSTSYAEPLASAASAGSSSPSNPSPRTDDTTPAPQVGRHYLGLNQDPLTYGQNNLGENQFWTPFQFAAGGATSGVQKGIGGFQGPVQGAGGGQDDLIPAMLADGEHVIDADTVSQIGDGSNKEGHKKIEAFKANIRAQKRSAPTNKIPPKTKALSSYMKSRAA